MDALTDILDRVAAAVVATDATDLPAIADLHTHFQKIADMAVGEGTGAASPKAVRVVAGQAGQLLEQIILRDVQDAEAALKQVARSIGEIQRIVTGGSAGDVAAAAGGLGVAASAGEAGESTAATGGAATGGAVPGDEHGACGAERAILADDLPLVQEFLSEARSHLDTAEAGVLRVEEAPDDLEAVNAIFRSFHTIKGVAGFLNLQQIGALAHTAENLLDLARKGRIALTGAAVDVVLESIDCMKHLIDALGAAAASGGAIPAEPKLPGVLARIRAAIEGKDAGSAAAAAPVSATPAAEKAAEAAPAAAAGDTPPTEAPAKAAGAAAGGATGGGEATVKVATDRLDKLINMVGELVIAQSMVAQDSATLVSGDQRLARNMSHLGKITRELQDLSMSMRMVPIGGVFQKMNRLVRDLARKAMKEIDFVVIGGETELDRNVVEAISDPLIHMVRNAADHGIELPEDRVRAGKPRAGRLTLKASHQAGNIVIEIMDDGRGLNKERILKKARDAGILQEGQEIAEQDIFRLIFHAGLSTAEKITDVSGRGVGMDVVRKNVEALRGRIDISSVEGKGTTFTIRLPLTLAVIDGLVVRVGDQRYIIPITSIEQSIQPKADQLSTVQGRGELCMVRGELLPLLRLYRLFGVSPTSDDPTKALVVIVQTDQRRCCLLVDELLGQQQVVIKTLGESIGSVGGVSGGAILGDGNVSLILDIPGIVNLVTAS